MAAPEQFGRPTPYGPPNPFQKGPFDEQFGPPAPPKGDTPVRSPAPRSTDEAPQAADDMSLNGEISHTYTTVKGSKYYHFDDGTTVRNKAQRPEHGDDKGIKQRSEATFYTTRSTPSSWV